MPVHVDIEFPEDNIVSLSPKFLAESQGMVEVRGRGNRIQIEDPFLANTARFALVGGATVFVGPQSNLNNLQLHALAAGVTIAIGANASFNGTCQITAHEASTIRIGTNCLFAHGCQIASSDVHKVLDLQTGDRINIASNIEIGDHVWVAPDVTILRNAVIGRDSIVGMRSVVRHTFPPNVSLAGIPARVIRTGVTWEF